MDPIAFQFGKLTVHWYGVMIALGFIAGLWTASRRAPRAGIHPERVFDLGPWLIGGAIVGARLLYVVMYWREDFAKDPFPEVFMIQRGGLVYYGGLIGAVVTGIAYLRWKRISLWAMADVMAPSIALGHFFGRLGCLFNGCCYGSACSLPWAIHFPYGHNTYPLGVHPTQVYEALLNLGFYAFLAWLFRRRKFDGQIFALYLIGYAFLRSFVELFRGDYPARQLVLGVLT
ncbi:MAG TPA: prolipoprotein diacylglyceryl transferase, partial [Clostridia bacterium]|nr:prolipoprotein diacylglyceryl transferase [Clostridia bacterium]